MAWYTWWLVVHAFLIVHVACCQARFFQQHNKCVSLAFCAFCLVLQPFWGNTTPTAYHTIQSLQLQPGLPAPLALLLRPGLTAPTYRTMHAAQLHPNTPPSALLERKVLESRICLHATKCSHPTDTTFDLFQPVPTCAFGVAAAAASLLSPA